MRDSEIFKSSRIHHFTHKQVVIILCEYLEMQYYYKNWKPLQRSFHLVTYPIVRIVKLICVSILLT